MTERAVVFEWGPVGARAIADGALLVLVDVLSFTTTVTVAVERGAAVIPAAPEEAAAVGAATGAAVAVHRSAVTPQAPWSLSPAAMLAAPVPDRLVLPSPNGSAIAAAATGPVVAACLRNATAVGRRAAEHDGPVAVVAAGERWPDGALRPALEDLLGAGAVLAALGRPGDESPGATATRVTYEHTASVAAAVTASTSGQELSRTGFARDVELATAIDASAVVPVLTGGAFRL